MGPYRYTVSGVDFPMSLPGQASDPPSARREAILFLSDLLRDLAVAKQDGSTVRIDVHDDDGALICSASARIDPTRS
jgi:hypothetical protein